jgi:hypothetical protein
MIDCTAVPLRGMQVVSFGQQKSDGKPVPHCCRLALPPHVGACREKIYDASAGAIADIRTQRRDILESRGRTEAGAMAIRPELRDVEEL